MGLWQSTSQGLAQEPWPVLDLQTGFGIILLTVAFFELLSAFVYMLPLPRTVSQPPVDEFRIFRWRNLLVSWTHGLITGSCCLFCVYYYNEDMWKDMMGWCKPPAFFICSFSAGYFLYDSLDIIRNRRMLEKWEILLHHCAIFVSALYPLSSLHAIGYHVLSMSIEMNTAFLHTRTILLMSGFPRQSAPVKTAVGANIVSFVLFRFVPLYYCTKAIFLHYTEVPVWFAVLFTVSMIILDVINIILFWRILRTDFFRDSTHLNRRYFGGIELQKENKEQGETTSGGVNNNNNNNVVPNGLAVKQTNGLVQKAEELLAKTGVELPVRSRSCTRRTNSKNLCDSLDLDEEARLPPLSPKANQQNTNTCPKNGAWGPPKNEGEGPPSGHTSSREASASPSGAPRLRGSVIPQNVDERMIQVSRSLNLRM